MLDKLKKVIDMAKEGVYTPENPTPEDALDKHVKEKAEEKKITNHTEIPGDLVRLAEETELKNLSEVDKEIEGEQEAMEDMPMFRKQLTIREIGLILGVEDANEFVKLFEADLFEWDSQVKNLSNSRVIHAENMLSELQQGDTLMQKVYHVAEIVSIENSLDFNDLDATKKWRLDSKKQAQNSIHLMEMSKNYERLMTDYLNVLNARYWANQHYLEAQNKVIQTLQADNIKLSKLYAPLIRLTKDLDKVIDEYVQQPDSD